MEGEASSKTIVPVIIIKILTAIYATKSESRDCSDTSSDSGIDFDNESSHWSHIESDRDNDSDDEYEAKAMLMII